MACIVGLLPADPFLLHCTICQCGHSKLEINLEAIPYKDALNRRSVAYKFHLLLLSHKYNFVTSKETNYSNSIKPSL